VLSLQLHSDQLAEQAQGAVPTEQRISLLLSYLRKMRVLVVLDNLEVLLEAGDPRGHLRPGFEAYGQLLRRVAETSHQSCLLVTSREKLADLRHLESKHSPVRSLRLTGLDDVACKELLVEKEVVGTEAERERLIEIYGGNPLALKIVAETIFDLFGGEIGLFLAEETLVFGGIADLLGEQFVRLSALEKTVLCWLTIAREPMTLEELLELLVSPLPRIQVLEAVDGLRRRSLIERGKRAGSFTLQSVVLEYVTGLLIAEGSHEIQQQHLDRLIEHSLCLSQAPEYERQTQERLLLSPLLANLQNAYLGRADGARQAGGTASVEMQLLSLLNQLRGLPESAQGYGPANLIALLRVLRGDLSGLDFSYLSIRGAYLQNVEMHDTSLAGALVRDSAWTSAVSATWAVAISFDGNWWATGSLQGQVHVWEGVRSQTLRLSLLAHTDVVEALAFSPDGRTLASGSTDGTVKLWDLSRAGPRGALLWTGWQYHPLSLAFSPDGRLLASGGREATVRLWDPQSGRCLQTLVHPSPVHAVAFSPDGRLLASGGVDGQIRLWERQKGTAPAFAPIISVQTNWVVQSLTFAPDGRTLASTSTGDQTVKLWEVASGLLLHTLPEHADQSRCVAWSPDGRTLAYGCSDKAIWLWDVEEDRCRTVLHGHTADVYGMAFTPEGTRLLSGSADDTLCVWDVESRQCVRVMQGYGVSLWDLDWSPDSTQLVSGDTDGLVTIWDMRDGMLPRVLPGHSWIVSGVGWSPDGKYLSSCGLNALLYLWDPTTRTLVQRFEDSKVVLLSLAWSPDGSLLACGTYQRGIQVCNVDKRSFQFIGQEHLNEFYRVAWSPNGTQLVGVGDDGCVYLWENADRAGQAQGAASTKLLGHQGKIRSVGWSPDGRFVASGGGSGECGELFVWDVRTGERVQTFAGRFGIVYALTWCRGWIDARGREQEVGASPIPTPPTRPYGPCGDLLVSGSNDGWIRWWDVQSGECVSMQEAHQGTIRSLKVSPDGKFLASCGDDGAIRIWDLESFRQAQEDRDRRETDRGLPLSVSLRVPTTPPLLRMLRRDRLYERLNITEIRGLNEAQKASLQALGAIDEAASSL
jgi:WD40 repeat protein